MDLSPCERALALRPAIPLGHERSGGKYDSTRAKQRRASLLAIQERTKGLLAELKAQPRAWLAEHLARQYHYVVGHGAW